MKKFIILFLFPLSIFAQIKREKSDFQYYNYEERNPYIADISLLDSQVNQYRVIFTGENHQYVHNNIDVKLEMIKYLHKTAGVKNLIIELGFVRGYLLDGYINKDSSLFNLLESNTSESYLSFYKALRAFNQTLPDSLKIHVHGIDVERFPDDAPILMANILNKKTGNTPESISFISECIRSYGTYFKKRKSIEDEEEEYSIYGSNSFYNNKTIDSIINEYDSKKTDFKTFLGTDFQLFDMSMQSLKEYRKYLGYANMPHQYVYRENYMFNNLKKLLENNPKEKYYGQFGRCHISQTELNEECNWWAFSSLAKKTKERLPEIKVLSMAIFYNTFEGDTYFGNDSTNEEVEKYKIAFDEEPYRLHKIVSTDSLLTKHYQYIIFSKNAKKSLYNDYELDEDFSYDNDKKFIDYSYGFNSFNFNQLNTDLFGSNLFNNTFNSHNFDITTFSSMRFYSKLSFNFFNSQRVKFNQMTFDLKGSAFSFSLGYSLISKKNLLFGTFLNFGHQQLNLNVNDDSLTPMNRLNGFGSTKVIYRYKNPMLYVGAGAELRIVFLKYLSIFGRAEYNFDFSRKHWHQQLENKFKYQTDNSKTSLSSFIYSFGLGIKI